MSYSQDSVPYEARQIVMAACIPLTLQEVDLASSSSLEQSRSVSCLMGP